MLCLRNARAFPLLPAALASVSFGFVLVRVRVRVRCNSRGWLELEGQVPLYSALCARERPKWPNFWAAKVRAAGSRLMATAHSPLSVYRHSSGLSLVSNRARSLFSTIYSNVKPQTSNLNLHFGNLEPRTSKRYGNHK